MESDDYFVVPRGVIEDASVVDLSLDMIAAANEALEGEVANATFIRFYSQATRPWPPGWKLPQCRSARDAREAR